MSKWEKVKLEDVVDFQKGFAFKSKDYQAYGTPIVRVSNFTDNSIDVSELKYIDTSLGEQIQSVELTPHDIVIATVGSWPTNPASVVGKVVCIPRNIEKALLNQNAVRLRVKSKEVLTQKFCYYLLKDTLFSEYIIGTAQGSANQASITLKDIKNYDFSLPPLEEQKRIAAILSSLDDKIEVNNQINKNLEEQAQAIFKSWFVDFEPFGGVMPSDWKEGNISEICNYSKGKISVDNLTLDKYFSTENMLPNKAGITRASAFPTIKSITQCQKGDTIISNIRPYFKKIFYCNSISGCSNDVLCFCPNTTIFSYYIYFLLLEDAFFEFMMAGSKGTKMPRGDKEQIMQYKCNIPSDCALSNFSNIVSFFLDLIDNNRVENIKLSQLRNVLLSKLMNGEINV